MAVHNFDNSLKKESSFSNMADAFYSRPPFSARHIQRYNTNSEDDMAMQRKDIDVQLQFTDRCLYVSEKFREHDYGDLLIEIFSKYPSKTGWLHSSKADRLAYFFPKRMFWINELSLKQFCLSSLFPLVEKEAIQMLLGQEMNSLKIGLRPIDKLYNCVLTQAYNNTNGDVWNTISITVPFTMLSEASVRYQQYRL